MTDEERNNDAAPVYAHYQIHQNSTEPAPAPDQNNLQKKNHKLASTVSLAVVFGLVAGVVFQGVNYASDKIFKDTSLENTQSEAETKTGSGEAVSEPAVSTTATEILSSDSGETSQNSVAAVASACMPSVVAITSVSVQEIPSFLSMYGFSYGTTEYSSEGSGSGIIVGENDDELLIATNNHVVEGATTLSVCFIGSDDGESESADSEEDVNVKNAVDAKIKGTDTANDLAVVAVQKSDISEETLSEIKIAQLGNSDNLDVGAQVVAIGNALGYGQSVTSGWISALNRSITTDDGTSSGLIQTDAAINPGNSGGALLNMNGEVIGINSAKYADNAVEGMGYAIPISKAQPILEELMNRQTRDKVDSENAGYLGVALADLSAEAVQMYDMPEGAFVIRVEEGSGAANGGIQKGDIIVKFDGQSVTNKSDLESVMAYYAAGETVDIVVKRTNNGTYEEQTLSVTLSGRSDFAQ